LTDKELTVHNVI